MSDARPPERWLIGTAEMPTAETSVASHAAAAHSPIRTRERFEEVAELGRGGMGRVYAAFDHQLARVVAVKQALSDDAAVVARFAREIQIAAKLQHPNLLAVLDAGWDELGRPFFVMNKIDGQSLERAVAGAALGARLAVLAPILAIVDAVAYAHTCGVIHRDIKPANILIGRFGEALLIDWGIARVADTMPDTEAPLATGAALTRAGAAVGTPGFMPPEQARGEPAGRAADVYALGSTLFYVLAGQRPFATLDATASITAAAGNASPEFGAIADEVPPDLVTIVKRAMAPRAEDRYPDAGALAADLRAFLAGQLVTSHHYSARERLVRWIRKRRFAAAIVVTASLVVTAVAALALRDVFRARTVAEGARIAAEERLADLLESLAASDPDYALARLLEVPTTSRVWQRARGAVTTAVHAGAGRGLALGTAFARPEARPDAREVVVIGDDWRSIRFLDPALQTSGTTMMLDVEVTSLQWTPDGAAVLAATKTGYVRYIDRARLRARPLDAGTARSIELVGGFAVIADGTLRILDPSGGAPRTLAAGVRGAARLAGATLCDTIDGLQIVRDDGGIVRVGSPSLVFGTHPSGRRFAYVDGDAIVEAEWANDRVTERGRWPASAQVARLAYAGEAVLAQVGGVLHVPDGGRLRRLPLDDVPTVLAWDPLGAYAVFEHRIVMLTARGEVALVRGHAAFRNVVVAGPHLLAVDMRGTLRSWRRDRLLMARGLADEPVTITGFAGIATGRVLVAGRGSHGMQLWGVRLDTLALASMPVIPTDDAMYTPVFRCARDDAWLAHAGNAWEHPAALFQVTPGEARRLDVIVRGIAGCTDDQVAVVTADAIELRDRRDPSRVVSRLPAAGVNGVAFAASRLLIHRPSGVLELRDAAGRSVEVATLEEDAAFALDPHGAVLYEGAGALRLWRSGTTRTLPVQIPNFRVSAIGASRDRFLVRGTVTALIGAADVALLVDRDGNVTRAANADAQPQLVDTRFVTASATGEVDLTDHADRTVMRFAMPGFQRHVAVTGGELVALSPALGLIRVVRLDEAPHDPAALRAYVESVTNARVQAGATFASFPAPE